MKTKNQKSSLEAGFNNMMNTAIEYELLKSQDKPIPDELRKRFDKVAEWMNNLSDFEYSRLIH